MPEIAITARCSPAFGVIFAGRGGFFDIGAITIFAPDLDHRGGVEPISEYFRGVDERFVYPFAGGRRHTT